ncbi:hypothetical protein [Paraliomyxa miuraensis]|uniref:hypothetical protein n=1 Tax=Paraliomyxa miuraensis TaxID=376150 RepID=UPI002256EF23|nr:hypothetical protein [Paraliomyxa miuraensis]MCX4246462.1 hypothetical protein [Paraliomyxa miuraensis]
MRRAIVAVVVLVVVALLAGAMFLLDRGAPPKGAEGEPQSRGVSPPGAAREGVSAEEGPPSVATRSRSEARAERDAMRHRILEAMHARERAAAEREGGSSEGEDASAGSAASAGGGRGGSPGPDDEAPTPGNLTDRTGNHGYLMKVMNEELMPLADECYELARQTEPSLAGMLVLDFEILGDEEIGGVVESVAIGQGNELVHPELVECMQESILSTTLPPPPAEHGGKDAISLSLRLSPDDGSG